MITAVAIYFLVLLAIMATTILDDNDNWPTGTA